MKNSGGRESLSTAMNTGKARAAYLLLVLAALLAWANGFTSPFVFDDIPGIVENPTIRQLWPPSLALPSFMSGTSVDGRPVTNYTFAISMAVGNGSVIPFHAMNLAIHISAAILLYALLRRTFGNPAVGEPVREKAEPLAFVSALLWMVHPLQTESVTYVIQRAESLSSLFYLLTLYFSARYFDERSAGNATLAVASCLLGMGSKEIVATAPVAVLLYDRCFSSGSFSAALKSRRRFYLALFSTWLALGGLMAATGSRNATIGYGFGISALDYFLTQLWAIPLYVKLAFWPDPLILDRGWEVVSDPLKIAVGGSVVLALAGIASYHLARNKPVGFAMAFFFVALGPTSSFIPVNQTISEHRTYLALAPVVVLAVVAAFLAVRRLAAGRADAARRASIALAVCMAALLVAGTHKRNTDYRTSLSIWEDTVEKAPKSPRALISLAHEYLEANYPPERSIELLQDYLAVRPGDATANVIMGNAQATAGNYEKAIGYYGAAIAQNHTYYKAYNNRGSALLTLGRAEEALPDLAKAVEINPWFGQARLNYGMALIAVGRYDEAVTQLDTGLTLNSGWIKARYQLGLALLGAGKPEKALGQFAEVLKALPDSPEAKEGYRRAQAAGKAPESK